jgi:glutaredoxin 3
MPEVIMYATSTCPYCERARRLLDRKGVSYTEINVDQDPKLRAEMEARSGRFSVPQIFIGEHHVGGYDDTVALDVDGNLDSLLGLA